jgi:hypothetical protein
MVGLGIFGKVILHPDIDKKLKEGLTKNKWLWIGMQMISG